MKVLHHPELDAYRVVMRREQVSCSGGIYVLDDSNMRRRRRHAFW